MDAVIINFERFRQEHLKSQQIKRDQIILECQQEISNNEEQIKSLVIQINQLQANIDFNLQLISRLNQQPPSHLL